MMRRSRACPYQCFFDRRFEVVVAKLCVGRLEEGLPVVGLAGLALRTEKLVISLTVVAVVVVDGWW